MNRTRAMFLAGLLVLACALKGSASKPRVVLIGIDGLTWKVIDHLFEKGKLPHLRRLAERGTRGVCLPIGALSPVIWTEIATGKKEDKHGIHGFSYFSDKEQRMVPYRSFDWKTKAVWNILSDQGLRVAVVNWWATSPAEEVNGFMVSSVVDFGGAEAPGNRYPPALVLSPEHKGFRSSPGGEHEIDVARYEMDEAFSLVRGLYRKHRPEFLAVYTHAIDSISHKYWDEDGPGSRFGTVVERFYEELDERIGELLGEIDDDATVIVVSDHGFTGVRSTREKYMLAVDRVLEAAGLLKYSDKVARTIDFEATTAYECDGLSGDERLGLATRRDGADAASRRKTLAVIRKALLDIRFASDGSPLFLEVIGNKEAARTGREMNYDGEYTVLMNEDADCFERVQKNDCVVIRGKSYPWDDFIDKSPQVGKHDYKDGIVILAVRHIRRGKTLRPGEVFSVDIAPTVLYLLGHPAAKDMDGGVIAEAIDRRKLEREPVRFVETYEPGAVKEAESAGDERHDREYFDRLRSLGYIQ